MAEPNETLTDLVQQAINAGTTFDQLEAQAIDPDTSKKVSRSVLWKIAKDKPILVNPSVVRGVAAALNISPNRTARAAARQYAGYRPEADDPFPEEHDASTAVTVAMPPGADPEEMVATRNVLRRVLRELDESIGDTDA